MSLRMFCCTQLTGMPAGTMRADSHSTSPLRSLSDSTDVFMRSRDDTDRSYFCASRPSVAR